MIIKYILNIHYIKGKLYPIIHKYKNINPINVRITEVTGDGNCM